jgi:hypothetical protein
MPQRDPAGTTLSTPDGSTIVACRVGQFGDFIIPVFAAWRAARKRSIFVTARQFSLHPSRPAAVTLDFLV